MYTFLYPDLDAKLYTYSVVTVAQDQARTPDCPRLSAPATAEPAHLGAPRIVGAPAAMARNRRAALGFLGSVRIQLARWSSGRRSRPSPQVGTLSDASPLRR